MNCNQDILNMKEKFKILESFEHDFINHNILSNPFLQMFQNGELSKKQIKIWISQQLYFSIQFPRCLAALYSRIEDFNISKNLMSFLNVEHWGSQNNSAHWKMFVKVLDFFEIKLDESIKILPFEETTSYLNYRLNMCIYSSVEEGFGALGFGHELINEKIFESYLKGMEQIEGINEDALKYFKAHVDDEPEDYQAFKNMIISYCNTASSFNLVKKGAENVLEKRNIFFNNLLNRIQE